MYELDLLPKVLLIQNISGNFASGAKKHPGGETSEAKGSRSRAGSAVWATDCVGNQLIKRNSEAAAHILRHINTLQQDGFNVVLRQVACISTSFLRCFTGSKSQKSDAKIFVQANERKVVGFRL